MAEWTKISEQKPPQEEWLLVAIKGYVGPIIAFVEETKWYTATSEFPVKEKATHWMPLPEMPK